MAKLKTDILFKARIGDLLLYPYRKKMVMRKISGFTTEALEADSKYELSRKNATEFGRVSSLCKQMRLALAGILPKENNLVVVNSFTKKMRDVLEHDTISARGQRQLINALSAETGRQLLKGYEFNPDATVGLDYLHTDNLLAVNIDNIKFPRRINNIGIRVHHLVFDFATGENLLSKGEWIMVNKTLFLDLPTLPETKGVRFMILEAQFYECVNGNYLLVEEDRGKRVTLFEVA